MAARVLEGASAAISQKIGGGVTDWEWHDALSDTVEQANERHTMAIAERAMRQAMSGEP